MFSLSCKVYLVLLWACLVSSEPVAQIKHGASLKIVNVADHGYLTATEHSFRPGFGVNAGKVLTEAEFEGTPNQIWDAIRFPNTADNQFWLFPKGATLNEITSPNFNDSPIPSKNLIELISVSQPNSSGEFLMKSTELGKCVQSQGPNSRILYTICNADNVAQRWKGETVRDDDKGRSKTKFYCKFSSG